MHAIASTRPAIAITGILWLKLAVLYLIVGVGMGIMMGASENFTLRPVHAHINLLGWATMALAGLIYCLFPRAGDSRLGRFHFWLSNLSLPVMSVALALVVQGQRQFVPILAIGEIVAALSILAFAANIFINLRND